MLTCCNCGGSDKYVIDRGKWLVPRHSHYQYCIGVLKDQLAASQAEVQRLRADNEMRTNAMARDDDVIEKLAEQNEVMREECERLRGLVHTCPTCGENCTECRCMRADVQWLREFISSHAQMHSPKMDGQHSWRFWI